MFASPSQGKNSPVVFVGTYTEPEESRSEGVYAYRIDPSSGKLTFEKMLKGIVNPAFLGIHPRQGFLYAVSVVQGFTGQAGGGPALPGDFKDENLCADVHVSPDGKYLYGSSRGHDSIVCFLIDENTGRLTFQNHTSTDGREPRNFAISPDRTFLLVANQKTNNIITFKIDPASGQLLQTRHKMEVSMPVCLKFVP